MERRRRGILRKMLILGAALALLVGALAALPTSSPAGKKKKKTPPAVTQPAPFCSVAVVDNYRAPLEKLQKIPALPEGGVLRFAPSGVTLAATGPQGLLVGGSTVGFRLANNAGEPAVAPRLNWTVLERLTRITKEGTRFHPGGLKRIDLAQLPAGKHRGLTFPLPSTPAIYSLEITIQNHRGRLLGRYGEYIRVVERVVDTGLTLSAYDQIAPGAYLESCFENRGTATITPTGTGLERFDGSAWRPVVVGPRYSPAQTTIQRTLGPGEAERIGTLIPPNALPGLYKLNASGVTDLGEPVALAAEFGAL
jgi:hypothetical protein